MIEENDASAGGLSPDQLIAEFEARIQEMEAAGGEAPLEVKRQLERVRRLMAAGEADGVEFMQAGDAESGLMGFSVPLEPRIAGKEPEKGTT
jgi:hypothetical protein